MKLVLIMKSNENFNKIGVTFFDQDISNMIDFSFSIGGYENIKKVYSKGVEVNFVSQLKDNITISIALLNLIVKMNLAQGFLDSRRKRQFKY